MTQFVLTLIVACILGFMAAQIRDTALTSSDAVWIGAVLPFITWTLVIVIGVM